MAVQLRGETFWLQGGSCAAGLSMTCLRYCFTHMHLHKLEAFLEMQCLWVCVELQ